VRLGEKFFAEDTLVRRLSASLSLARQEVRTHTNELIVTIPINVTICNLNLPSNELSTYALPARATFSQTCCGGSRLQRRCHRFPAMTQAIKAS
jgi:hypothetical protein